MGGNNRRSTEYSRFEKTKKRNRCETNPSGPMCPLHNGAAASLLLRSIGIITLVDLTPYRRYHKVTGVVAIINQRECCLRHLDARTIQILPQTRIKLCQPPILEIGNALLLVPNIASPDFVGWNRHIDGCSCSSVGERERGGGR